VTLEAGRNYLFDLKGLPTGSGTLRDPYLRGIYDDNGTLIPGTTANNGGVSFNSRLDFTVEDAGTYYVSAGSIHHQNNEDGTYRLSATDITDGVPDDYTDGTGTAGRVEVGGSATGEIEFLNDRDWFAVTLEAGRTYRFDMNGSEADAGTLYSPFLRGIHDSNGNLIAGTVEDSSDFTRSSQVRFTAAADGIHYVSAGAWSYTEGTYTLSVAEVM
jgi:serralysin